MTLPISGRRSPNPFDIQEIFRQKTDTIKKIKDLMAERKLSNDTTAFVMNMDTEQFLDMLHGNYGEYPLAYLKTLLKRLTLANTTQAS